MSKRWVFEGEVNVSVGGEKVVVYTNDDATSEEAESMAEEAYQELLRNDFESYIETSASQLYSIRDDVEDMDAWEVADHRYDTDEPVTLMFVDAPVQEDPYIVIAYEKATEAEQHDRRRRGD